MSHLSISVPLCGRSVFPNGSDFEVLDTFLNHLIPGSRPDRWDKAYLQLQDVVPKDMTFLQHRSEAVGVSRVTFCQAVTSAKTIIYEGHFEILSLSGMSLLSKSGDQCSQAGGLSMSLDLLDGHVLGGVPRVMMAASPVQVILGDKGREVLDNSKQMSPTSAAAKAAAPGSTWLPAIHHHKAHLVGL